MVEGTPLELILFSSLFILTQVASSLSSSYLLIVTFIFLNWTWVWAWFLHDAEDSCLSSSYFSFLLDGAMSWLNGAFTDGSWAIILFIALFGFILLESSNQWKLVTIMEAHLSLKRTWMIFLVTFAWFSLIKPIALSLLIITFKHEYISLANSLGNIFKELKASLTKLYFCLVLLWSTFEIMCTFKIIQSIEQTNWRDRDNLTSERWTRCLKNEGFKNI